ncbi:hypothetical protein ABZP36_012273 [Zizania latifolia]
MCNGQECKWETAFRATSPQRARDGGNDATDGDQQPLAPGGRGLHDGSHVELEAARARAREAEVRKRHTAAETEIPPARPCCAPATTCPCHGPLVRPCRVPQPLPRAPTTCPLRHATARSLPHTRCCAPLPRAPVARPRAPTAGEERGTGEVGEAMAWREWDDSPPNPFSSKTSFNPLESIDQQRRLRPLLVFHIGLAPQSPTVVAIRKGDKENRHLEPNNASCDVEAEINNMSVASKKLVIPTKPWPSSNTKQTLKYKHGAAASRANVTSTSPRSRRQSIAKATDKVVDELKPKDMLRWMESTFH